MKKFILFALISVLFFSFNASAQEKSNENETVRVYAELLGRSTNVLGLTKNCTVDLDLGQIQSVFKSYTLQDENEKNIKFSSMVAAMNYMGERGWKFVQTYVVTIQGQNVYHWLMYKDISSFEELLEGLNVKNMKD